MTTFINYGYGEDDYDDEYSETNHYVKNRHFMTRNEPKLVETKNGDVRTIIKRKKYTVYSSGFVGGVIRHAKTGEFMGRVGKDDMYFFKASMTTGVHPGIPSCPVHLFYFGPNEYEQHHKVVLPPGVKEAFAKKQIAYGYESV